MLLRRLAMVVCSLMVGSMAPLGIVVTYPASSHNFSASLAIQFYDTYTSGNPIRRGSSYDIGHDAQALHGCESTVSGHLVSVGQSWELEGSAAQNGPRDGFALATSEFGVMQWSWLSKTDNNDEGIVAVAAMPAAAGGDFILAGFSRSMAEGACFKRYLIRLDHATGREVWSVTFNRTAAEKKGSHAAFESIATDRYGGILIGGVTNNVEGKYFKFKSGGNVPDGDAFLWRIPQNALTRTGGPSDRDIAFAWIDDKWTSVKAVRVGDAVSNAVVALHRLDDEFESVPQAGLALIDYHTGVPKWGPIFYPAHAEVTDVAVAPDGSGFVIVGHGSMVSISQPSEYYGRITRIDAKGRYLWTNTYASNPATMVIYNECWGVQPYWDPTASHDSHGWILACGTGIENGKACHDRRLNQTMKQWCLAGAPSAWGGVPRKPSVWSNAVVNFEDSKVEGEPGKLKWSSVSSYLPPNPGSASKSTAAEFITPVRSGGFAVFTDEVFGIGFMKLGGYAAPPSPPPADYYYGALYYYGNGAASSADAPKQPASAMRINKPKKPTQQAALMAPSEQYVEKWGP